MKAFTAPEVLITLAAFSPVPACDRLSCNLHLILNLGLLLFLLFLLPHGTYIYNNSFRQ